MVFIEGVNMSFHFENVLVKVLKISHGIFTYSFPRHCHGKNYYELHYNVSGGGALVTDEGEFPLEKGLLYMTGPHVYHEQLTDTNNPTEEYCIQMEIIPSKKSPDCPAASLLTDTFFWIGKDNYNALRFFEAISEECSIKSIGYIQAVKNNVSLILTALVRNYSGDIKQTSFEKSTTDYKRLNIIEGSFFNDFATITIGELSKRLNLSERQTQRFLTENYKKTFSELRAEARLNRAKELIKSGLSLSEAAHRVGYSDIRSLKDKM